MPFYKITLSQEYFGQLAIANFNYQIQTSVGGVSAAELLLRGFGYDNATNGIVGGLNVLSAIRDMQSTDVRFIAIDCYNMYEDADFITAPFAAGTNGLNTGGSSSPTLAYGFFTTRTTRAIRRGQKRIVGIPTGAMGAGGLLNGGGLNLATITAVEMTEQIGVAESGTSYTFQPAVLGVEQYTTPSGKKAYRKYVTESVQNLHVSTGFTWLAKSEVRTQVSRQYRRGA